MNEQNALALARNNFNNTVGRPLNAPVTVRDVPGVSVGTVVTNTGASGGATPANPSGLPPAVGTPEADAQSFFNPPLDQINKLDVDQGIGLALKARPELRADQVNVQAEGKQIAIARAGLLPSLTLGATGNYYPVTDFQNPRHSLGLFTATVSLPLYDGGLTQARIREARANEGNSVTTYGSDQTTVELQVRQAYLNFYNTANQIGAANSALAQAIAARQLAQLRFANGVGLYLEVTDAESALNQAENSQVNAVYDYLIARAQYENALGTPNLNPSL